MTYDAKTVEDYLEQIPSERVDTVNRLRNTIKMHLPKGFEETMLYGMIAYVVPLSTYPEGYLGQKDTPLPFVSVASQKHTINVYHNGLYVNEKLSDWFKSAYKETVGKKPDMGKSCIRFKPRNPIPFALLGILMEKMTVKDVIAMYEDR